MIIQKEIRQIYKPIQPITQKADESVSYYEIIPDTQLHNFIYYYWEFKSNRPHKNGYDYKVVPNGCIDIFFEINNPIKSFVTGFSNKHSQVLLGSSFHYIGICFMPAIFSQLYNVKASALSNRIENLKYVIPKTSSFIAKNFTSSMDTFQIKALLDQHYLKLITDSGFKFDNRLYESIHKIIKSTGELRTEIDLNTGISPRQLRRLFDYYIGDTPKAFQRVVRFQKVVQEYWENKVVYDSKFIFNGGFYDQSHFIKDFKAMCGLTPKKAFKK